MFVESTIFIITRPANIFLKKPGQKNLITNMQVKQAIHNITCKKRQTSLDTRETNWGLRPIRKTQQILRIFLNKRNKIQVIKSLLFK